MHAEWEVQFVPNYMAFWSDILLFQYWIVSYSRNFQPPACFMLLERLLLFI